MSLVLANERISLELVPSYGARVTELTDRTTGRQWLVSGPLSADQGEDAVYGAAAARGWDECFPTVTPCEHPAWGGRLRDHGLLWGRSWDVLQQGPDRATTRYAAGEVVFARTLRLAGATLTAEYSVTNLGVAAMPYLWSQHCLLATSTDDRIAIAGQGPMTAGGHPFDWPRHEGRDLTRIDSVDAKFALKSYAMTPGRGSAEIVNPKGGIRFEWDDVPAFGLWQCYGGWPIATPVHQVALEPTTAAADDLVGAVAQAQARILMPNTAHNWSVRITMTGPDPRSAP